MPLKKNVDGPIENEEPATNGKGKDSLTFHESLYIKSVINYACTVLLTHENMKGLYVKAVRDNVESIISKHGLHTGTAFLLGTLEIQKIFNAKGNEQERSAFIKDIYVAKAIQQVRNDIFAFEVDEGKRLKELYAKDNMTFEEASELSKCLDIYTNVMYRGKYLLSSTLDDLRSAIEESSEFGKETEEWYGYHRLAMLRLVAQPEPLTKETLH